MARSGCLALAGAETMVALMAIQQCKELGLTHVHLEGDENVIIDAVNCEVTNRSRMGHIVEDIKVEVQAFSQWQMSLCEGQGIRLHTFFPNMLQSMIWINFGVSLLNASTILFYWSNLL